MVSISPRLCDDLDYEEPEALDPRFALGFRSISLQSAGYEDLELYITNTDHRPFSAGPDTSANRRRRRQRQSDVALNHAVNFAYRTVADGDAFRLAVVLPGSGTQPIQCRLI